MTVHTDTHACSRSCTPHAHKHAHTRTHKRIHAHTQQSTMPPAHIRTHTGPGTHKHPHTTVCGTANGVWEAAQLNERGHGVTCPPRPRPPRPPPVGSRGTAARWCPGAAAAARRRCRRCWHRQRGLPTGPAGQAHTRQAGPRGHESACRQGTHSRQAGPRGARSSAHSRRTHGRQDPACDTGERARGCAAPTRGHRRVRARPNTRIPACMHKSSRPRPYA
jgi:hypothetical protein